MQSTTVKFP
jgi:Exonuclease VII, large subunit